MPRLSITASYNNAINQLNITGRYLAKSRCLSAEMQGFVAEMLLLRLFSILETCIRDVAIKVACGTPYKNGINSTPTIRCKSVNDAIEKFKNEGREKSIQNLRFANVSQTNESIKYVINEREPFRVTLSKYGSIYEEMRCVRNHIAHRTQSTSINYKKIVKQRYGANYIIKTSSFLISSKRDGRVRIDDYIRTIRILINEITNG